MSPTKETNILHKRLIISVRLAAARHQGRSK